MPNPTVGLLPFYIALYDRTAPQARNEFAPFIEQIRAGLVRQGVKVQVAPICCVAGEFAAAIADFEKASVDLLACVHLAYSPSLESIDALSRTSLPLLLLDTTMDYEFGQSVNPARLMFNHGVHGVQDLACVLRRRVRPFEIVAGHVSKSDVLRRAANVARAARAAGRIRGGKVVRIGESFAGMGDFAVTDETMRHRLGVQVRQIGPADLAEPIGQVTEAEVDAELASDRARFDVQASEDVHRRSVRLGLGLRRMLANADAFAFSMNFLAFNSDRPPVDTVPFLEICKAMSRGLGYAGEGDVLTAALVGGLLASFERTTFTEIFCPDWAGGSLFLSHMGELNPATAGSPCRLVEKNFPWTPAKKPAMLAGAIAPGQAMLVNLAPGSGQSLRLISAAVESLGDGTHPDMANTVRGWIRPALPLADFLEEYSRLGGTHHSALVFDADERAIAAFARFTGLEHCPIQ